jgi:hypothetical protein
MVDPYTYTYTYTYTCTCSCSSTNGRGSAGRPTDARGKKPDGTRLGSRSGLVPFASRLVGNEEAHREPLANSEHEHEHEYEYEYEYEYVSTLAAIRVVLLDLREHPVELA